jgi:sigma-B regulation protein RsbU (phosphoserine phosphatase)
MSGENGRGDARELNSRDRVDLLLDTIAEVTAIVDLDALLARIVDRSLDLTRAERGLLALTDGEERATLRIGRDSDRRNLPLTLSFSRSVLCEVLETCESRVHEVALTESDGLDMSESMFGIGLRRLMCVPLTIDGTAIGAIYVDSTVSPAERFAQDDLRLLEAIAHQAAIAITNARLRDADRHRERLETRMRIAGEIQRRAAPPNGLLLAGFDVYGVSIPCEETCGDYFDYILLPGRRWALVVGDVVGHGLEAALYMLTLRGSLRSSCAWIDDGPRVFAHLNEELGRDMKDGEFVTLLFVDLDQSTRSFRVLAAGHPPPLLYRSSRDTFEELPFGGPLLAGGMESEYAAAAPVPLENGDILVLYTDGIIESQSRDAPDDVRAIFGETRLRDAVRHRAGASSRDIVAGILDDVRAYTGNAPPDDDRTLVVVTATDD